MTYPEPNAKESWVVPVCGWAVCIVLLAAMIYTSIYHPEWVEHKSPPLRSWPTEPGMVNTANIVRMDPVSEENQTYTRIWFSGGKHSWLFLEPPSYFEGPTRIITATRVKEGNH